MNPNWQEEKNKMQELVILYILQGVRAACYSTFPRLQKRENCQN